MPTNISGRLTLTLLVALAALTAIFWPIVGNPRSAFHPNVPLSEKINLRPGIDMVGGTSLLYDIQIPRGMMATEELAQEIMTALKRRVDPGGQKNLEDTNVAPAEVIAAVEKKDQAALDRLAMGSPAREALFRELVKTFTEIG